MLGLVRYVSSRSDVFQRRAQLRCRLETILWIASVGVASIMCLYQLWWQDATSRGPHAYK